MYAVPETEMVCLLLESLGSSPSFIPSTPHRLNAETEMIKFKMNESSHHYRSKWLHTELRAWCFIFNV